MVGEVNPLLYYLAIITGNMYMYYTIDIITTIRLLSIRYLRLVQICIGPEWKFTRICIYHPIYISTMIDNNILTT